MDRQITHPTKEQVRAYMAARECARRPPPAPEEIRRQLGWRLAPSHHEQALLHLCMIPTNYGQLACMIPTNYGQLAAQLALDWFFAPLRPLVRARTER